MEPSGDELTSKLHIWLSKNSEENFEFRNMSNIEDGEISPDGDKSFSSNGHSDSENGAAFLYDEIDKVDSNTDHDKLEWSATCFNIVTFLLKFPSGINCTSLYKEYKNVYNHPINFPKFRCRSVIHFAQRYISSSVAFCEVSNGFMRKGQADNPKAKIIFRPYYKAQRIYADSPKITCAKADEITKKIKLTYTRILNIVKLHERGIFINEIKGAFKKIYNEDFDSASDLKLSTYINALFGFTMEKSPLDKCDCIYAEKFILRDVVILDLDEKIVKYQGDTEKLESIVGLMDKLQLNRGIAFLPLSELAARYQQIYHKPFQLPGLVDFYRYIEEIPELKLYERYILGDSTRTIFCMKDFLPPTISERIKLPEWSFEEYSHGEVAIGDIFSNGTVYLVPFKTWKNELKELHQAMNERYQLNFAVDQLPNIHICTTVAAKIGNQWCRSEVISVDMKIRHCYVFSVDYGTYCNVHFSQVRSLEQVFISHLPKQAVMCVLSDLSDHDTLTERSINFIWEMIRHENYFKVTFLDYTGGFYHVSLTHASAKFTFSGNITPAMAHNYNRPFQRNQGEVIVHTGYSYSATKEASSLRIDKKYAKAKIPWELISGCASELDVIKFQLNSDSNIFYLFIFGASEKPYYISRDDVYNLSKQEEKASAIHIRLLIKRWINKKCLSEYEYPFDKVMLSILPKSPTTLLNPMFNLAELANLFQAVDEGGKLSVGSSLVTLYQKIEERRKKSRCAIS